MSLLPHPESFEAPGPAKGLCDSCGRYIVDARIVAVLWDGEGDPDQLGEVIRRRFAELDARGLVCGTCWQAWSPSDRKRSD